VIRIVIHVIWGTLTAWVVAQAMYRLFARDQSQAPWPLSPLDEVTTPTFVSTGWALACLLEVGLLIARRSRRASDLSAASTVVGEVVEVHDTGVSSFATSSEQSKEVRAVLVRIDPSGEEAFVGALCTHDSSLKPGDSVSVRYFPDNPDVLYELELPKKRRMA